MDRQVLTPGQGIRRLSLHTWMVAALLLLALIFSTYNLAYSPPPWFDEGWYLQVPRNLVLYGQYAPLSSEGFRNHDTVVGVSPLFYLPIAAIFRLLGVGLLQARAVIVFYFLATCLLVYAVAQRLYGSRVAVTALVLFIFAQPDDRFTSALLMGRQVMAEVPALLFLMVGIYMWITSFEGGSPWFLVLSGLFFGFAMKTKAQFMIVLPPVLVGLGLIDRFYYRQHRYRRFVLPLGVGLASVALQYVLLLMLLGREDFVAYLTSLAAASGPQVRLFFNGHAMERALKMLLRSEISFFVIAGLAYGIFEANRSSETYCAAVGTSEARRRCSPGVDAGHKCSYNPLETARSLTTATNAPHAVLLARRMDRAAILRCFPLLFVAVWLTWFIFASVGWARYTFAAFALSYLFVAKLLDDTARSLNQRLERAVPSLRSRAWLSTGRRIAFLLVVVLVLLGLAPGVRAIFSPPDRSAHQLAAYIDGRVDGDETIETWEWEIPFLTPGQTYHHPPTELLNSVIAAVNLGTPYDPQTYDFQQYDPTYILVGPFASWTGLYPTEFVDQRCSRVISVGAYHLYKIAIEPPQSQADGTSNRD